MNYIIKTHSTESKYSHPCFFILNKGMNSGKPQKAPFTNSFVAIFENQVDLENAYFIAYSLYQSRFWHRFLTGSVIPFLRIQDFKKEFISKVNTLMEEHEQHQKNVAALKLLEQKEQQLEKNIHLISELRKAIIHRFVTS